MTASSLEVQENVQLAPFTTLGIGGPARFFAEIRSEAELLDAVVFARKNKLPLFILGGGSNLLVSDAGFPGLVLHLILRLPTETASRGGHVHLRAAAGVDWDSLVHLTCEQDLSGIECLAGIPGLTGGAPIQNIGAYGQEVSQTIQSVRALDVHTGRFTELRNEECDFSYRSSRFNCRDRGRYAVTAVTFRLSANPKPSLTYADLVAFFGDKQPSPIEVYQAVREIRRKKGMLLVLDDPECRSAGSFFKNPLLSANAFSQLAGTVELAPEQIPHWPVAQGKIKVAAAWLVERAGFPKGFLLGRVGISSRHSLALINRGDASYAELAELRSRIRNEVTRQFGILLEQEPVELGI